MNLGQTAAADARVGPIATSQWSSAKSMPQNTGTVT
jgi:hypothetical protein